VASRPDVFRYFDYREFLQDWFDARKRKEPGYSFARFAAAGGCSRSALPNVLRGARVPRSETLDAFARAMELTPTERNYLGLLVEYATAADVTTQRDVLLRMLQHERYGHRRRLEDHDESELFRFFEYWYVPAICMMSSIPGFREDPVWIADQLRPRIDPEQAQAALETLFDLGMVLRDDAGRLTRSERMFASETETWLRVAKHVHSVLMPDLLSQIDARHAKEQHLMALTLSVPLNQVEEFKARITKLTEQLDGMSEDPTATGPRRVYQLAVQLLPLSEPIDGD